MFEGYFNLRQCFVANEIAWVHGGPDFQSRFEKSTAQAEEGRGRCGFCETWKISGLRLLIQLIILTVLKYCRKDLSLLNRYCEITFRG